MRYRIVRQCELNASVASTLDCALESVAHFGGRVLMRL